MTAPTTLPRDVDEYLAAVRAALEDLPAAERDDLVAEVEASLADAAAEGAAPLASRLGPPEEFAAELRAAAGLHEPPPAARRESRYTDAARALLARVAAHRGVVAAGRLGHELAPIWWVARGYLAVAAVAYALDAEWSTALPPVPRFGTAVHGLGAIVLAVVASVALGLALRSRGVGSSRLLAVVNLALLAAAIPVAGEVADRSAHRALVGMAYAPSPQLPMGLVYDGEPVTNVYPYSRDGRLLHDVLLYDGTGRPLDIRGDRFTDPDRRFVVTNGNRPLFNVFPIRYYEPGTKRVARPNAAPYVEHPLVLTPPLRRASR